MARLAAPSLDPRLRKLLHPVLTDKCLDNDALWQAEISPLIQSYLASLGHSIRQSATTNANAPNAKTIDEIQATLAGISRVLGHKFARKAPFTVHRVAELLLRYNDSGYSLMTVASAQKWLSALARTLSVSSSELTYNSKRVSEAPLLKTSKNGNSGNYISEDERRRLDLPQDIRFVRLDWPVNRDEERNSVDTIEPPSKKQRPSEDVEDEILSDGETSTESPRSGLSREESSKVVSEKPSDLHVGAETMDLDAANSDISNSQEPLKGLGPKESSELESGPVNPQYLDTISAESRESSRSSSSFYENGSIDQDDQKRRKGEVLI